MTRLISWSVGKMITKANWRRTLNGLDADEDGMKVGQSGWRDEVGESERDTGKKEKRRVSESMKNDRKPFTLRIV